MITRKDYIKRGNRQVSAYFHAICAGSRKLYNTSIFSVRNTMSGLNKPPEERTLNETEVLHFVYLGITLYNRARTQAFADTVHMAGEFLRQGRISGSLAMRMAARVFYLDVGSGNKKSGQVKRERPHLIEYPTRQKPFLSYEVLEAVLRLTENHDYRALPAQVNSRIYVPGPSWRGMYYCRKASRPAQGTQTGTFV